jgi:hypothetical protein
MHFELTLPAEQLLLFKVAKLREISLTRRLDGLYELAFWLEAHIPPHLIDKVQAGLSTDVRFNSFAHSPQLVVEGKVLSVSGDLLSDPAQPQFSYYLGTCASDS